MPDASRIFIVTPLKDEEDNINQLFEAISRQTKKVYTWVIVENNSVDSSKEMLEDRKNSGAAESIIVLNLDDKTPYALGPKYAGLVKFGFDYISENFDLADDDLIGILDADNFPDPPYYELLSDSFRTNPKLGISSGMDVDADGNMGRERSDWVRGSCRLWRYACMRDAGYIVGPSADTLSLAKAEIRGWDAIPVPEAIFRIAREVGARVKYEYYGASAHHRGCTPLYALGKGVRYLRSNGAQGAKLYLKGYFKAYFSRAPKIDDPEILSYFGKYNYRLIRSLFERAR